MKKILFLFIFTLFLTISNLFAQSTKPNPKLMKANEKVAYYIKNAPQDYEEIRKMSYDLPWSGYEKLTAFKLGEIKRFMEGEKEMKGKNIFYLAFSIIYKEYEEGRITE